MLVSVIVVSIIYNTCIIIVSPYNVYGHCDRIDHSGQLESHSASLSKNVAKKNSQH